MPTSRRIAIPIQVLTLLALWSILALTGCDKASAPGQIAMLRLRAGSPPRYDVVVSATDGSASRLLTGDSVRGGLEPVLFGRGSWAPDDRHLALAVDLTRSHGRIAPSDVYVLDTRTERFRRLTHTGRALAPSWAPDGRTIAFAKHARGNGFPLSSSLWVIESNGRGLRELLPASAGNLDLPASWAPDGSRLAFTRRHWVGGAEFFRSAIYIIRRDGSGLRRFADHASDAAWSPDGRKIAFASDRDKNGTLSYGDRTFFANELYVASVNGSHFVRLTRTKDLNEGSPSWSPDGSEIVYQRGRVIENAEGTSVLRVNSDGSDSKVIAGDPQLLTWYAAPSWSPRANR